MRPTGEVGWRAHHGHAHVGPDPHGDHVLREGLAEAHAGIEALGDDIDEANVDADLHVQIRIGRQELRRPRAAGDSAG